MSLYFADADTLTFGVQSSNTAEVAQFSSTTDDAFLHLYTNNYKDIDNFATGVAIGSKAFSTTGNDLYLGNVINGGAANASIQRVLTMRQDRIGIGTTTPTSILHVVGSNLPAASNILLVQAINSPPYPALVVDRYGYVGIGTAPNSNQTITIAGKLMVDNIQVGGSSGGSGSSKLITAYGMVAPSDTTYLDFAYGTMSNISNVVTPLLQATNITQTITNIANYTLLNDCTVSVSPATIQGNVTFTTNFFGNCPSYIYTLTTVNGSGVVDIVQGSPFTSTGSVDRRTVRFTTGTYTVSISASASNGSGAGSYSIKPNITTFTVGVTDNIGTPAVNLTGSPAITISNVTTTVSGIPYYTNQAVITFPIMCTAFTNIYNTINPTSLLTYVLRIAERQYVYSEIFTNVLASNTKNTTEFYYKIIYTNNYTSALALPATVYNINDSNTNATFVSSIAYIGTPINESTLQVASAPLMPITSITRVSVSSSAVIPSRPSITTEISTFTGSTISSNDAILFPYTMTFYSSYITINMQRGTYAPSYTPVAGSHNVLVLKIQTITPLYVFVLNMVGASGVQNVFVNWSGINNGANWCDAKIYYTSDTGCGAGTPTATRFPIRIPFTTQTSTPDSILSTAMDIYIAITFSGSIPISGISITNQ